RRRPSRGRPRRRNRCSRPFSASDAEPDVCDRLVMTAARDFIDGPFVRGPWRAVPVLGVTQILSWGSIFYTPVLILPLVAAERGWSISFAMAGFSVGLLVAGLTSPYVGRAIDRFGGHVVMTAG